MMLADLPPSSWVTRFTVGAAAEATEIPARVEPVKETMATCGCEAIAEPTVGPSPFTRLKTPVDNPASSRIRAKRYAERGAISLGLKTIVQPAPNPCPTFLPISFMVQFHHLSIHN